MQGLHYLDTNGRDLYQDWLDRLRDITGRVAIQRRIDRNKSDELLEGL